MADLGGWSDRCGEQRQRAKPTVIGQSIKNASSTAALRDLPNASPDVLKKRMQKNQRLFQGKGAKQSAARVEENVLVVPRLELPHRQPKINAPLKADPVVQHSPVGRNVPDTTVSFNGMSNPFPVLPPDTNGDVGPNHYVQTVNIAIAIWDKSGNQLVAPKALNELWAGLGGICEANNDGDPIVMYDQLADRWMVSQFALNFPNDFHECIAVSKTPDPTGEWHLYDFKISDSKMNDYPHFGIWPDGYYMSINQFDGSSFAWAGAGAVVFEREKMLTGAPDAKMVYFDLAGVDNSLGGMLPTDMDGVLPPPAGTPNAFLQVDDDNFGAAQDQMQIWEFHVDWATPANSTFAKKADLPTAAFVSGLCNFARNCITQPGGTALDAISDRLMFRVAYRNFGDHDALVLNHTVDATGSNQAGVRWYEVRDFHGTPSIYQQGTYAPDGDNRWMASIAMDAVGNIGLGFARSSATTYPSVGYTARLASDPLGQMAQGEGLMVAGGGSQSHSSGRWGDYSSMNIDPVDDCTFWYTQEYYAADSSANWSTRIGSFKMPNCVAGPSGTLSGTVTNAATGTGLANAKVSAGASSTFTDAEGHYTLILPVADYDLVVRAYGYSNSTADDVAIIDDQTTTQNFALSGLTPVTLTGKVNDGSGHGWPLYATLSLSGDLVPATTVYTNPETGEYSLSVYKDWPYQLHAEAMTQGYNEADRAVTITSDTPSDEDFALTIGESCTAPGYQLRGLNVGFDFGIPGDWTVSDEKGSGVVWMTNADSGRSNYTGGSGLAATADSDFAGYAAYDTSLITPSITVADLANTQLNYRAMHYQYSGLDFLDLDISVDGGTWTNISHWLENHYPGQLISVDLASYLTGATAFKLRWRYSTTESGTPWDMLAQVDDVHIGSACVAKAGGLVLGKVIDDNTDLAINGALVDGAGSTTTFATPDDDGLDDGFYQLFVAAGKRTLVAHASNYTSASVVVDVESDAIVMADDLVLTAGKLDMPATIDVTLAKGKSTTSTLTIENVGSADATYSLFEINAPVLVIAPDEKLDPSVRRVGPKDKERMAAKLRVYTPPQVPTLSGGTVVDSWATALAYPWGISVNRDANDLWVGNIAVGGGDDLNYQFTARGEMTKSTIDTSSWAANFAADMTYDDRNGTLWQVNVGGEN